MMYPDYLVHFNPNHDPKTGQFTFSKYLTKNGKLTDYVKDNYGITKLNQSSRATNVGYEKAQKMIKKDLKQLYKSGMRWLESDIRDDYSDAKFEYDVEKANENKNLISDLKVGIKTYCELEKDDWRAASDYQDNLRKELSSKYPENKDIIFWINIGEALPYNSDTMSYDADKFLSGLEKEGESLFPYILNNDAYYEPMDVGDEYVHQVTKAVNTELSEAFINKYGTQNIPSEWLKYVN